MLPGFQSFDDLADAIRSGLFDDIVHVENAAQFAMQPLGGHHIDAFGVGPGSFLEAYRTRYVLPSAWQEFNLEHPHNVYLDHWTRLGLLGLVAGLAVQVAFFKLVNQRINESARTGDASACVSLGLLGIWVIVAIFIGKKFHKLQEEGTIVQ